MGDKKKFTAIAIGVFTSVLGSVVWDGVKGIPILSTLNYFFDGVIWFLNIDLKVWWILVSIIVLVIIFFAFVHYSSKEEPKSSLPFLSYKKDKIKGIDWQWHWGLSNGKWDIKDLTSVCPYDKTPLYITRDYSYQNHGECPRCSTKVIYKDDDLNKAKMIILDNAQKLIDSRSYLSL